MDAKRPSLKERLSRLELELDELIRIQESSRGRTTEDVDEKWRAISVTRSRTMLSGHRHCCVREQVVAAPLTDISKLLQHINQNISKGSQAIAKLATVTTQDGGEKRLTNERYMVGREYPHAHDNQNVWKSGVEKKNNEDALFKELRDEKDKRMRAESQVKSLKDELKRTQHDFEQKTESSVRLLQEELTETLEKLKQAESEIQKRYDEYKSSEYVWPLKYDTLNKELQDEKQKRKESDENVRKLQDTLQKVFHDTEEHLSVQKTANWLKNQNDNLLCLTKKLRGEAEAKDCEIYEKSRCIEDNVKKMKQLIELCVKLRDSLVVAKEKYMIAEEKLKVAMEHGQKLSESMLQAQRKIEDLERSLGENKNERSRLADNFKREELKNDSLHSRLEEISEMMKKQNKIIHQQSDTIDSRDQQLKLSYEHIKLLSQRLEDLEKNVYCSQINKDSQRNKILHAEFDKLQLDLENEKENSLIKDKIIDSHLRTIADNKSELIRRETEINKLKRDISETERNLSIEKITNAELQTKIKHLQLRKEELKQRVEYLEEEGLQTTKLEQIERQIQLKQKEWEESKEKLVKENVEALDILKRSYEKLAKKSVDYEKELKGRQKTVDSLKLLLQEKDKQIDATKCEILQLTNKLHETEEREKTMKKRFEESLQSACDVWQKTMQQFNI